jgi:hypothetical protein
VLLLYSSLNADLSPILHDNDIVTHHDEYLLSLDSVSAYQLVSAPQGCIAYNDRSSRRESDSREIQKRTSPR